MELSRHCALCDNQIVNLKDGTTCKLNGKKPEFNKTCSKIELNDKFELAVKKANIELENIKKAKTDTYGHVLIFALVSLAIMFAGYYLGTYAWESGVISTVPLIIIGVGFGVLPFALGPLNKFRSELSLAQNKKDKLDEVLNLYNIDYEIYLKYGKKIHGTQEVQADLKINRTR